MHSVGASRLWSSRFKAAQESAAVKTSLRWAVSTIRLRPDLQKLEWKKRIRQAVNFHFFWIKINV